MVGDLQEDPVGYPNPCIAGGQPGSVRDHGLRRGSVAPRGSMPQLWFGPSTQPGALANAPGCAGRTSAVRLAAETNVFLGCAGCARRRCAQAFPLPLGIGLVDTTEIAHLDGLVEAIAGPERDPSATRSTHTRTCGSCRRGTCWCASTHPHQDREYFRRCTRCLCRR